MLRFGLRALFESAGAAYVGSVLAYLVEFGVILLLGNHRWIDAIQMAPTFFLPIVSGASLAYLLKNHLSRASYFAWIVPGCFFLRALAEVTRSPYSPNSEVWNTLIGIDCGSSECLYEALFTVPLVCALSYSVTSAFIRIYKRNNLARDTQVLF